MDRLVCVPPSVKPRGLVDDASFRDLVHARELIAAHAEAALSLAQAADFAFLSPFHFQRKFVRAFGESPHEFATRLRLDRAKRLLREGSHSVLDVCYEVGYRSVGTFSYRFAQRFGMSPSEFRRVFAIPERWALRSIPTCYAVHALRM